MRTAFLSFTYALILLTALPAQDVEGTPQPTLKTITLHIKAATVRAEIASTEPEREAGLMFRTKLADNAGMLFLMPTIAPANFWMKNTLLPLSVAYIGPDGKILEIHDMQPLDLTNIRSESSRVAYALEMNQHWFELNHIQAGDALNIAPLTWDQLPNLP